MPTEYTEKILKPETNFEHRVVNDHTMLKKLTEELRAQGKKIVLTQGVWDLIHEGHALYLEVAKGHGDVLIVGVDSDELTRARKGPSRPIVPQAERIKMLVHLRHVDIVTIREAHQDIGDLIRLIQPDVLITSSSTADFDQKMKDEYADVCGKIITMPPQAPTSTSARIRSLAIDGAEELANEITKLTQNFLNKLKNTK